MARSGDHNRRGMILPVMLLILILLGLLAAGFAFQVHADHSAMNAVSQRLQTRLAAEAGIEKVLLMLRTRRDDVEAWYNNPEELNRIIVWTPGDDETLLGSKEELDEGSIAYRFSIVADDPFDDEDRSRYGITDESAKLNVNTATRDQLMRLIGQIATEEMVVEELVDALLDWRDEDNERREFGAEAEYYAMLETPYRPKNGTFDTVEELLLVKGFDGRVLYGEDYDRNGLLGPNEDDGEESFPLDDGDGELNRGLHPYITALSRDFNTDSENRPRVYLFGDSNQLREELTEVLEDSAKVDFIVKAISGSGPADEDESDEEESDEEEEQEEQEGDGVESEPEASDEDRTADEPKDYQKNERRLKRGRRLQAIPETSERRDGREGGRGGRGGGPEDVREGSQDGRGGGREGVRRGGRGGRSGDRGGQGGDRGEDRVELEDEPEGEDSGAESGDPGAVTPPVAEPAALSSPADLLTLELGGDAGPNPLTLEDLPILMDRTTTVDPIQEQAGLINIMTAPPQVLRCLAWLSGEDIGAILQTRRELPEEARATTAWLVTQEVISLETYQKIAPLITVRGRQFTIQSIGYADHLGAIARLQVIVEMRGSLGQVLYHRDLTKLGAVFPIREDEEEYGFGAFDG